jgi:cytosine/adenosine deaminase-related metal-dependent hydrolase
MAAAMKAAGIDLDLEGLQILPGLINAHDHLELNLFPRLGRGVYPNASCWARDIYHPDRTPIREHLRVSKELRLLWGGLKNLLSGVTLVCHHNPSHPVFDRNFPVRVAESLGWAHSLDFSPDLAERFRATPEDCVFIVHLGEGTDRQSACEIFRLRDAGALDARTVLVHAVALDKAGLELVRNAGAAIVWCPSANLFTLGRTLKPPEGIPLALGTDSAITGEGDLLDEIALARTLTKRDVLPMVSTDAARILRIPPNDDFIAAPEFGRAPELVVIDERIRLISPKLAEQLPPESRAGFQSITLEGRAPVLVDMNVGELYRLTLEALGGDELRLAGKRVSI